MLNIGCCIAIHSFLGAESAASTSIKRTRSYSHEIMQLALDNLAKNVVAQLAATGHGRGDPHVKVLRHLLPPVTLSP